MDIRLPVFNSIKIVAGPAVFECGDGFAVVWATNTKGSGYVEVEGKKYWDFQGGVIKTHDNVHVVKLSKENLTNKKYKVVSQRVNFKFGYSAIKGNTVTSETIHFNGAPSNDEIKILTLSDVHDMAKEMYEAVKHINSTPDLIFLLGDISSELEYKKKYIEGILSYADNLSKGEIPVVYTRGNHETRGEYASQMINYFPNETGEYYFKFNFGELSAIVLDTGEDKNDDHEEYSGLVDFSVYREQEYNWLCSLKKENFPGKFLLAFSHMPKIENHFGRDWTKPLKNADAKLLIGGHHHKSEFIDGDLPIFDVCGKREKTGEYGASLITLRDNIIHLKTVNNKGEILLENSIKI